MRCTNRELGTSSGPARACISSSRAGRARRRPRPPALLAVAAAPPPLRYGCVQRCQGPPPRIGPHIRPGQGPRNAHPDQAARAAPCIAGDPRVRACLAKWTRPDRRSRRGRYPAIRLCRGLTDPPIGSLRNCLPPSAPPRGRPKGPRGRACRAAAAVRVLQLLQLPRLLLGGGHAAPRPLFGAAAGRLARRCHTSYPVAFLAIDGAAAAGRLARRGHASRGR